MSKSFKVGNVVYGVDFQVSTHLNGLEGTILEDLGMCENCFEDMLDDHFTAHSFIIEWSNGEVNEVVKDNIRKNVPPEPYDVITTGEDSIMNMFIGITADAVIEETA